MSSFLASRNQHRLVLVLAWSIVTGILLLPRVADARFASQFSLAVGEEFNDNIFFDERKEHDFVTTITPTLSLVYQPSSQTAPTFSVNIDPSAQIFANHPELNNFGEDLGFDADYTYRYSPRLRFTLSDRLERRGESRTGGSGRGGGSGGFGGLGGGFGRGFGDSGERDGSSDSLSNEGDLLSRGDRLENEFEADWNFAYTPNVTFRGNYSWDYTTFLDEGERETAHSLGVGVGYRRWREHNLRAKYNITLLKSRDGESDVLHDYEIGDDYFSSRQIELTPTLTVSASTGIALQTGRDFRLSNSFNLTVNKIWRTASFAAGINRGLTSSEGVSGPSFTTSFFSFFNIQLTRRLFAFAGTQFSFFDTKENDFKTFQTVTGIQYWMTSWLSANLAYSYRWLDPEGGSANTSVLRNTKTDSNAIFFFVSAHFDIWPNIGTARGMTALSSATFGRGSQLSGP